MTGFPIVVQISCEPDTVTGGPPGAPWRGVEACFERLAPARDIAADRLGAPIVLSWMMRTDLHMEEHWGDAAFGLVTYRREIDQLREQGDFIGLHAHPIKERERVEDYRDEQWTLDTLGAGIDAFERHLGHPPACVSWGRGWTSDALIDLQRERGVAVDMSVFPGRDQTVNVGDVELIADIPDLSIVPDHPYSPSATDWRVPADEPGDGTWILPFTCSPIDAWMSPTQRVTRRILWSTTRRHGYRTRTEQNYFFAITGPGFPAYIDQQAAEPNPYLTLSIRASRLLAASDDEITACFAVLADTCCRHDAQVADPVTTVERLRADAST